jgi:hypothetical protein
MITTDYDGWIITLPLATERQLFPSFSDGADVGASVARFNAMMLDRVQEMYAGAWVNQESRQWFEVSSPDSSKLEEVRVIHNLTVISKDVRDGGEWYVS